MSNETLPELTSLYLDWENQRQLLGEAEILEKEKLMSIATRIIQILMLSFF